MNNFQFLVDVNLPRNFSFFNSENFLFVSEMNLRMPDTEIWNLAISKEMVILTRDSDFYSRALLAKIKPKIVYFKLGNILIGELHLYFQKNWKQILQILNEHTLIVATRESVDVLI